MPPAAMPSCADGVRVIKGTAKATHRCAAFAVGYLPPVKGVCRAENSSLTIFGVTKMSNSFLVLCSSVVRNSTPTKGGLSRSPFFL